jgi:membrane protease YdiL (CAAX protease family)
MNSAHAIIDYIFFALLLAIPLIEWKWTWPRYLKRLKSGAPGVRARFYRALIAEEWMATACLMGWWALRARPWSGMLLAGTETPLRIGIPPPLRLWAGLAFVALLAGVLILQKKAILARPETMQRMRPNLAYAEPLLPHTEKERRLFWLVSFTAGACEEIFFRGFLIWFLAAWMGPLLAVLLSSVLFGSGHIYMGWAQAPKTALVGLVLSFIALSSASLLPAMVLHAALDWNSGELGYRVLRDSGQWTVISPCGGREPGIRSRG